MCHRFVFGIALFLVVQGMANGQVTRYELGRRFKQFEQTWAQVKNQEARKRTAPTLAKVTPLFLSLRLQEAAKTLDQSRHLLLGKEIPGGELLWAESLQLIQDPLLLSTKGGTLNLQLNKFYDSKQALPDHATWSVTIQSSSGKVLAKSPIQKISELPSKFTWKLPELPEGDHALALNVSLGGKSLITQRHGLSIAKELSQRISGLEKIAADIDSDKSTTETETLKSTVQILNGLAGKKQYETIYPAVRLLQEAEDLAKAIAKQKRFFDGQRTGQFWLTLQTKRGRHPVRLLVPEQATAKRKIPLVVALHGAGGSENLFFEGYGDGEIVRQCQQRGWFLVAPRSPLFGFSSPVAAIVDELASRYPIDKNNVFVVGHSMGAAQAVNAAQEAPDHFAAIAALGGSGRVNNGEKIKDVPFFVGVGTADFALGGAKRLAATLKAKNVRTVELRVYPDIEHIMIVPEALPAVFAQFDRVKEKSK